MKEIKEFDTFSGTDGYVIVDGLDAETQGGKIKVPNYSGVTDGYVLTKTSTDGTDDVVWSAPAGGGDPFSDITEWFDAKNPARKVKDYDEFPIENKGVYIDIKKDNNIIKHRMFFQYGGSGNNFYGPWGS